MKILRSCILALLTSFAGTATAAQQTIFRLVDSSGFPVANARVSVVGSQGSVATDRDGMFSLVPLPPVPFDVAVADERGAWKGLVRVETLSADRPNEIRLPAPEEVSVTVIAGVSPSTAAPPASASSVLSKEEVLQQRPAQLGDALADIPGAGRLEEGHSIVPSIRGLARSRTLLLLDDARVTAERRAGASAGFLDPFSVENIEVVRGPGSVAYGSDALGGVIHARTPLPRLDDFGLRLELAGGIGENGASGGIETNIPVGPDAFLIQYHQRFFGDYDAPSGPVDNSASRDRGLLVRGLFPAGSSRLFFGLQLDRVRDMGKPATDSNVTRAYYPEESSSRFTFGADLPGRLGFDSIEVRSFVGADRLITNRERLPAEETTRRLSQSDIAADDASLRVSARRALPQGEICIGVDLNGRFGLSAINRFLDYDTTDEIWSRKEESAISSARRIDAGLFVESERVLLSSRLKLAAGLRGDVVSTTNKGGYFGDISTRSSAVSGFAAFTVFPRADLSTTLQYARGFRDPLLSERYFRGVSGRGFVVGNPTLTPETSDQFDLAIRASLGPVHAAAYGYVYRISDLIERYMSGEDFYFRNRGEVEIRGAELEIDGPLRKNLSLRIAAGVARGRVLDDDSPAADIPPHSISLTLHHQANHRVWWRSRLAAYAADSAAGPTEIRTPGYTTLDFSAGMSFRRGLEAQLLLRNILDRTYPATSDSTAVNAPGRSATIVLSGEF
ncbi:MAG: TonB-dependent receptor [Acidobacteria bacterium]|nr:TonB-dependent receptor [Acidobacteriota bacterium]